MRNLLVKLIRDNELVNPIGRTVIRMLGYILAPVKKLASAYRIYGTVSLKIFDVRFRIYSKADDNIANELFYSLGYEMGEFRLLKELTKQSRLLLDVGANTGIFSIYAASANPRLRVLSFEPHPSNLNRLTKNISINGIDNIRIYANAVGSNNSEIELTVPADLSISTTASANDGFTRNVHRGDYAKVRVQQITLDDLLIPMPLSSDDVIKIDVEYYELDVLKGAREILKSKRPLIILEMLSYESLVTQFPTMKDNISKSHSNEVLELLTSLGYFAYAIGPDRLRFISLDKDKRNFLFVPYKVSRDEFTFEEISTLLTNRGC